MRRRTRIGTSLAGSALLIGGLAMATMAPALAQETDRPAAEVEQADDTVDGEVCPNAEDCPLTEDERAERMAERDARRAERMAERSGDGEQRGMGMGADADRPGRGTGGDAVQRRDGSMRTEGAERPGRGPADGVGRGLGTGDCLDAA